MTRVPHLVTMRQVRVDGLPEWFAVIGWLLTGMYFLTQWGPDGPVEFALGLFPAAIAGVFGGGLAYAVGTAIEDFRRPRKVRKREKDPHAM